jgi:nucleotide-binding universal stress UspA family protein
MNGRIRRVVAGVSTSLAGLEALRVAVAEARTQRASLVAVRAWSLRTGGREPGARIWRREIERQAAGTLTRAFDAAMGGPPGDIPVELMTAEGLPERVLVEVANRTDDLLVVGAPSGRWRLNRTVVVRACARRAGCRMLVVPQPELARLGRTGAMARMLRREADGFTRLNS